MEPFEDYYEILQVHPSAEPEVIEAAYRKLAQKYHPDVSKNPADQGKMKKINIAHDVLANPEQRKQYHAEWLQKKGGTTDKPKPIVEPSQIVFKNVTPGTARRASFRVKNIGGPYSKCKISPSNPDSWAKVINCESVDPNQPDELPLRVDIEVKGNEWGRYYSEYIRVELDEQETQVRVDLETELKPVGPPVKPTRRGSSRVRMTVFGIVGVIIVALLATHFWPSAAPVSADSPWPMFHHDLQHTGRSLYSGSADPHLKWNCDVGGKIQSAPTIGADGTIYVGSYDKNLYAINRNGTLKWTYTTGVGINGEGIRSSVAIGKDSTVYVGSADGKLYALNSHDGTLKWQYETGRAILSSPAIGPDGTIYVGAYDNKLYAIKTDGSYKWSFLTGGFIYSSPAIGGDGTIYVGSYDKNLYAINPGGSLKWRYMTGDLIDSSPAIGADGTVYVGSFDHKLYAINAYDGSRKWSFTTGDTIYSSPAIGADGTIYMGSFDGTLYAIHVIDGSPKWKCPIGSPIWYTSPAVGADGTIYVGSVNGKFYAINPDNGSLKWSLLIGDSIRFSSPAIGADGTIYVGAEYGCSDIEAIVSRSAPYVCNLCKLWAIGGK